MSTTSLLNTAIDFRIAKGAHMKMRDSSDKPVRRRGFVRVVAALLGGLGAIVLLGWAALAAVPFDAESLFSGRLSTVVLDRRGQLLRAYLASDDQWRIATTLHELSPWVIRATLAAEDRRFFQHGGVDGLALARAAWQNLRAGRIVSGASTISMQVVGLADSRERTLWRKCRQIFRALQLERQRTKTHILELYLTNAPYGGNICGVQAAAWRYFGKSARELTAAEAALLAGIPQAPARWRPDRFLAAAQKRALKILQRMRDCGWLSEGDLNRARRQLASLRITTPSGKAPHFCDLVRSLAPDEPRILTTLDLEIQTLAEGILRQTLQELEAEGVTNGACVVLDVASGDVLALVGSADYWNPAIHGQVNGATAPRSPGSTLKPFIYALAFDRGSLLASSRLADVPGLFTNYDPRNFDEQWRGLVTADRALAWSLNVPAMQVLERVGCDTVLEFLDAAGVRRTMPARADLGLTLAVGTCSVRLLELANAYAMLARQGLWQPYRLTFPPREDEPLVLQAARRWNARHAPRRHRPSSLEPSTTAPVRLLSPEACTFVTLAMSDPQLRDPADTAPELRGMSGIAWKTGTSNGYRDAWTFAYDRRYVVGVWLGNFDGKPSRALVGGRAAAPAALKLMQSLWRLRPCGDALWPDATLRHGRGVVVCRESGDLATELCPTTTTLTGPVRFERGIAVGPRCSIHRRLLVDASTGEAVCAQCLRGRPLREIVVAQWPLAVARFLEVHGQATPPPRHAKDCPSLAGLNSPRIVAPHAADRFVVTSLRAKQFQSVRCEALADSAAKMLYWFVDGELVGASPPHEPFLWPPVPGHHELRCVDDLGRGDTLTFEVHEEP